MWKSVLNTGQQHLKSSYHRKSVNFADFYHRKSVGFCDFYHRKSVIIKLKWLYIKIIVKNKKLLLSDKNF